MEHAKLWQWAAMGLQLSLSHGDTALNVRLKWLIVAYDSLASDAISHHLSPSTPWSFSSPADGGGPNGRWYISNNKAVEVSDFLCGRGLISSSEHRNLLPVMLEEDSWQYKARCVAVRGKVPICGYPSTLLKGIPWESEFEGRKTDEMEKCYFLFPPSDHGLDLMSGEISSMAKPLVLQTRLQVARPFLPEDGEEMKSCSGAAGGLMEKQICKSLFHPYWSSVGRIVMTVRCQIFFASGWKIIHKSAIS